MASNPYQAPQTTPDPKRSRRRWIIGVLIAIIATPVALAIGVLIWCASQPPLKFGP